MLTGLVGEDDCWVAMVAGNALVGGGGESGGVAAAAVGGEGVGIWGVGKTWLGQVGCACPVPYSEESCWKAGGA